MLQIYSDTGEVTIEGNPNKCPFCHIVITPIPLYGHRNNWIMEVLLVCPNTECRKSFIGYYHREGNHWLFNGQITQGNLIGRRFSETIEKISSSFLVIYNQSYLAEQQSLTEICGVGFRKALEFLIKDYLILNKPERKEQIEKAFLGNCISNYIDDSRIKSVAKRAVWLGNDETHYVRKWEGKNLQDLKNLIDLTIHWIEMESLTKSFESDMPE